MTPFIAAVLGITGGLFSLACNVLVPKYFTAKKPEKAIVYGYSGLLMSTILSVILLVLFYLRYEPFFVWFGVSLCVSYIIGLMGYFVQSIRLLKGKSEKK